MLITGGFNERGASAWFNPHTNSYCDLPDLPDPRNWHNQIGLMACGGYDEINNDYLPNCVTFNLNTGVWEETHSFDEDHGNSVWVNSTDGVYLMGGWTYDYDEVTLLKPDGTTEDNAANWEMEQPTILACQVLESDGRVIVVGGVDDNDDDLDSVHRYDENGYVEALPSLNVPRVGHGCAGYYDEDENLVKCIILS